MNQKECEQMLELISAARYFSDCLRELDSLMNFYLISDLVTRLKEKNLTVGMLKDLLNDLSEVIE